MIRKIFLTAVTLLLMASPSINAAPLDLVCSEWEPYVGNNLTNKGPLAELVTMAFKKGGYSSSVNTHTWADAMAGVKSADHDAAICVWFSKERNKEFRFSVPIILNRVSFLKRKTDSISWDRLNDLQGYKFAKLKDGVISKKFDNADFLQIREMDQQIDAIRLLVSGEVDMVAGDEGEALSLIQRYLPEEADKLDFVDRSLASNSVHVMVSRTHSDSKELISAFNKGMAEMRADGSYQTLLEQHHMERLAVE
ncbi:ABC transporter substrate-binding protein [Motiliproteus sp. MSK22-1]|uniref:substrate-binding periplasmic protein n=1 Tax=Motiliproteus sp. MSK22-1 TaxID=1897630 RepID=UPI00097571B3|nr:transporter substrate-binding domain-containing protein [Motiliproteus sp. MSK22-1]OMH33831.1 hypothetical protein BGP75_12650 [Motiliproteus sp. MSK22-1]